MDRDTTLPPHFHPVDQFQLVITGTGRVGRHDVGPGSVHYADAATPYGPIVAGGGGLGYLTLRCESDSGASWMPESQGALRAHRAGTEPSARRNLTHTFEEPHDDGWKVFAHGDELRSATARIEVGKHLTTLPRTGRGGYVAVVEGIVRIAVAGSDDPPIGPLAPGSVVFTSPDDASLKLSAISDARVVDVQFAQRS